MRWPTWRPDLGVDVRLHVVAGSEHLLPADCFERRVVVGRAGGSSDEPFASTIDESALATEWEWERSPELTLVVTPDVADAVTLCNRYSPRFITSVITADRAEFERCYEALDTPFTGNGFTRWVDGQYALDRPELGLANWQGGRLLGRGAILSGDSVFTVRYVRARRRHHPSPMTALPPPDPATFRPPVVSASPTFAPPRPPAPTLPVRAAVGAIAVLTISLIASKFVLEALVDFDWPLVVYVLILALLGYGPSVMWCRYVSRHWGSDSLRTDIGLAPRWADLGWGPVIWLAALGAQIAIAAVIVGLGVPISNNTDGITDLQTDRTYVVSIVITAVDRGADRRGDGVPWRRAARAAEHDTGRVGDRPPGCSVRCAHLDPVRGRGNVGLVLVLSGVGITFGAARVPPAQDRPDDRRPRDLQRRRAADRVDGRRRSPRGRRCVRACFRAGRLRTGTERSCRSVARHRNGRRPRCALDGRGCVSRSCTGERSSVSNTAT